MDFSLFAALAAGFVATLLMSLFLEIASANGVTSMPTISLIIGTMFSGNREDAVRIGGGIHFVVMGTFLFGVVYAALFSVTDFQSPWLGAAVGSAHGAVMGILLGQLNLVHPRIADSELSPRHAPSGLVVSQTEVLIADPGIFGVNWGNLTPPTVIVAHAIYGWALAAVYSVLV